ncbi:MAG: DUF4079 family protein, partial [Actinomycetia bacterium]|nr:DUF4079 family protein [Actinomycetes bacterium]
LYNFAIMLLFVYQASLGLKIRKRRKAGQMPASLTQKHRVNGPIFALLAVFGYAAGLAIALLDTGQIVVFRPHFFVGTILIISIATTFIISRRIDDNPSWRTHHFWLGLFILAIYILQIVLGIGVFASLRPV